MDISIIISLIAMISTVISTIIAIIQVKKCKKEINSIRSETFTMINGSKNSGINVTNEGLNTGIMAQEVKGGVHLGK